MKSGNSICKTTDDFKCCPPLPHYPKIISDNSFVKRNIDLSDLSGSSWDPLTQINSTYGGSCCYPGGCDQLATDERNTMSKCQRLEYNRQEKVARRNVYPEKYWQDLNTGRWYQRGLDDNLDDTIAERNNTVSGFYNAKHGIAPGDAPFRNPYCENMPEPFNPDQYRAPLVNMNTMGCRSYKWDTIYQKGRYPSMFCRSGQYNEPQRDDPRCDPERCHMRYPEEY